MHEITHTDAIAIAEDRLRAAMLTSDVSALDVLIDDELVFIGPDGAIYTKSMDLEAHRSGIVRIHRLDPSERQVLPLGEVMVVSVRMETAATIQGQLTEAALRYTRVWRYVDGNWRIVAGSIVPITAS